MSDDFSRVRSSDDLLENEACPYLAVCPICQQPGRREYLINHTYERYFLCAQCGAIWSVPAKIEDGHKMAEGSPV
jgi:hypothetical protein